jgi:hypothetical protein
MLKMLNNVERISQLIPKFKQQLIFLEEREKLFRKINDDSIPCGDLLPNTSTISKTSVCTSTNSQASTVFSTNSKSSSSISSSSIYLQKTNLSSTISIDNSTHDEFVGGEDTHPSFPDVYQIPSLPYALVKDIEAGILNNFGPHFHGRQILIDAVVHDLIDNYNLL